MTPINSQLPPALYVVATPIGNLKDITLRALEVLKTADVIACEDTRTTKGLLSHYGIEGRLLSYHEHNEQARAEELLDMVANGKAVALVSDAGTPLISDPGFRVVQQARARGVRVYTIPGPSSVTAALSIAGLPTDGFYFAGFLPAKSTARRKAIEEVKPVTATLVFLEAANRLPESLSDLAAVLGDREATIARELTKLYEELRHGTLGELAAYYSRAGAPKGEVVIVIGPPEEVAVSDATLDKALRAALKESSLKDAASDVAKALNLPRQRVYKRALEMK